jgi:hypothetical protein
MEVPPFDYIQLKNLGDASYYMLEKFVPERQIVVMLSRVPGKPTVSDKTRWLDLNLSVLSSPYPIQHIEFKANGDAVVRFISRKAMEKSLSRAPLKWENVEVATRPCMEEDILDLYWVIACGDPQDIYPPLRQTLQMYGEVRGEYAPHPADSYSAGAEMVKFYFYPKGRAMLPPTLSFVRPDRKMAVVNIFTADGQLAPRCAHFGKQHTPLGCPFCYKRLQNREAGA